MGSQGNSHQDDTDEGLALNGLYKEDTMSEGDAEDDLNNLFFQYQLSAAPVQQERVNTDLASGPSRAPVDIVKPIRDPRHHVIIMLWNLGWLTWLWLNEFCILIYPGL